MLNVSGVIAKKNRHDFYLLLTHMERHTHAHSLNKRDVLGYSLICVCLKASLPNQSQLLFSSLFEWLGVSSVKSLIIYFECASQGDHEMVIASCARIRSPSLRSTPLFV